MLSPTSQSRHKGTSALAEETLPVAPKQAPENEVTGEPWGQGSLTFRSEEEHEPLVSLHR